MPKHMIAKNWLPSVPSLIGLVTGTLLTLLLWRYAADTNLREQEVAFDERVQHASLAVDRVIDELVSTVHTVRSLLETSPGLSAGEFERAMASRNQRLYPTGLQFVGLVQARGRQLPNCTPLTTGRPCLSIARLYPLATNQHLLDLDILSLPHRREAIARAANFGYIAFTRPLASAPDNIADPGLLAFLPIYERDLPLVSVEDRRRALLGLAVASFSFEDMIRTELGRDFFGTLGLSVVDKGLVGTPKPGAGQTVLDSDALIQPTDDVVAAAMSRTVTREVAGRRWTLQFTHKQARAGASWLTVPMLVMGLGGLLTLLLALYLQNLSNARSRAEAIARRTTASLRRREAQLQQALSAAQMGIWQWDAEQEQFTTDRRAGSLLALDQGSLDQLLKRVSRIDRRAVQAALQQSIKQRLPFWAECRLAVNAKEPLWIELFAQLDVDDRGQVRNVSGLVRDVTSRVQTSAARRRLLHKLVNAEEQERRRIARELHDQLGQEMTAIIIGLRNLETLPADSPKRETVLEQLRSTVHQIDSRVDKFMLDLRPVVLDDLGLQEALKAQFAKWSDLHGIAVHSHLRGLADKPLPFGLATTIFRVVQESLTNVARHSNATAVDVIVESKRGHIDVVVEDNGHGSVAEPSTKSFGLAGMRERVESIGGRFRYESVEGRSFSVYATLPLQTENTATSLVE